jgi:hypothetical protein
MKDRLLSGIESYFDGYSTSFYVTLNSNRRLKNASLIEDASIDFNRKVSIMMKWIAEYLMGKNRTHLMRAVSFNELGSDTRMLHCHVIIGLAGETKISLLQLQNFVNRKWQRFFDKQRDGERSYWQQVKHEKKFYAIKDAIDLASSASKYEWELEVSSHVQLIRDVEGAWGYSTKQYWLNQTSRQYCSYGLH